MFEQDGLYFFKFKYMVTFYNNFHILKESESLLQISKKCFKKCEYLEHFNKVSKGPLVKTENFRDGPLWNWNNKYMNLKTKIFDMAVLKHYARNFIKISQIELIMLGFVKLSNFSHRKIIFFTIEKRHLRQQKRRI